MFPSRHCFDSGLLCTGGTVYTLGIKQNYNKHRDSEMFRIYRVSPTNGL